MLYQTLFVYKYDNGGRPTRVNVDELGNYPDDYVYRILDGGTQPEKVLISDLQSEVSDYTIYCVAEDGDAIRAPKSRTLESTWADKMIRSYQSLHPEQKVWFDMITVDTIADRDALQYDPDFAPESWIRVRNDENGESHEYVLAANRQFWVDTSIIGVSEASGKRARDELYNRLSSGSLLSTFGPSGQNKSVCDFVYAFAVNGNLTAGAWTKTGNTALWDFGNGEPLIANNGVPAYTLTSGVKLAIATVSVEDSFNTVTKYRFSNVSLVGAIPKMDFSNVTDALFCFDSAFFSGALPPLNLSSVTDASTFFRYSLITSFPNMELPNATTVNDMFLGTKITSKLGRLVFGDSVTQAFGLFYASTIDTIDVDITLPPSVETNTNSMFWFCTNVSDGDIIRNINNLSYDNAFNYARLPIKRSLHFTKQLNVDNGRFYAASCFLSQSNSESNLIKHIPHYASSDWDTELPMTGPPNPFFTCENPNLTEQSITNLLSLYYDRRFTNKSLRSAPIILNLQSYANVQPFGSRYKNVQTPRHYDEILYKLIENPDNEDINSYKVLPNLDGAGHREYVTQFKITTTDPGEEFTLSLPPTALVNALFYDQPITRRVDWGDGTSSTIVKNGLGDTPLISYNKVYDTPGEYTVTISNIVHGEDYRMYTSGTFNIEPTEIGISGNGTNHTFRLFKDKTSLEVVRFNPDRNNQSVHYSTFEMFRNCTSLRIIEPFTVDNYDGEHLVTRMFTNTGSIESVVINNMGTSFSITNNQLNDVALNALFEGLADVTTNPQTITITGNPGVGTGVYDPTIATNKGWTVVDA